MRNFFVDLPRFEKAQCATVEDKDLFFPDNRTSEAEILHQLKAICRSCIHEKECLEYALEKQIPYGVWGGKSAAERDFIAIQNDTSKALKGMAIEVKRLRAKGLSAQEIAPQLGTSAIYIRRIFKKLDATEQGATQSHQQTKNSLDGSPSSLGLAQ